MRRKKRRRDRYGFTVYVKLSVNISTVVGVSQNNQLINCQNH